MDIDQMNLENERQLNMIGLSDYGKVIAKLLVWLPALPKQKLDDLLDRVKVDVRSNGEPTEILSAYYEEEERAETDLLEVSFIKFLIQNHAPIQLNKLQERVVELEGANSGLDALVDQFRSENQELLKLNKELVEDNRQLTYVANEQKDRLDILEHNEKFLRKQVRDLSIQALTCLKILKICSNPDRYLTHAQRRAFSEVGLETLDQLFPKGISPENFPSHEDKIQINEDHDPIPFNSSKVRGGDEF